MVHLTDKTNKLLLLDKSILKKHKEIGSIRGDICYVEAEKDLETGMIGVPADLFRYPFAFLHLTYGEKIYQTSRTFMNDKGVRWYKTKDKVFKMLHVQQFGIYKAMEYDKRIQQLKEAQGELF
jgi:hypothetical protein